MICQFMSQGTLGKMRRSTGGSTAKRRDPDAASVLPGPIGLRRHGKSKDWAADAPALLGFEAIGHSRKENA